MAEPTPRLRVELACDSLGHDEVVRRCVAVFDGAEDDAAFIVLLGGAPARRLLADGVPGGQAYWLRVWALRGLLWAWPGDTVEVLCRALGDEHWRVREMACKVIARHRVGDALGALAAAVGDDVPRVRAAAQRAVVRVIESSA